MDMFLPSGIIMCIFFIMYLVLFPEVVLEALGFKNTPIIISVLMWLFFVGFILTIAYLSKSHVG